MNLGSIDSLAYLYPEGILVLAIITIFIADLFVSDKERLGNIALLGAALALVFTSGISFFGVRFIAGLQGAGEGWLFHRMIALDSFAIFFKVILSLSMVGAVWMSLGSKEIRGPNQGEYYGILLASGLGMFFMASATNLLLAYLSLEGMLGCVQSPRGHYCTACWSGKYRIPVDQAVSKYTFERYQLKMFE